MFSNGVSCAKCMPIFCLTNCNAASVFTFWFIFSFTQHFRFNVKSKHFSILFFVQTTCKWIAMWQLYVWNGSINLQRPGNKSRLLRYVDVWIFECKIMVFIISNIIILTHSLVTRNLPHKWMKTKLKRKKNWKWWLR